MERFHELAYLAGLFDGEGSFSIQVNIRSTTKGKQNVQFSPKMTMTLRHRKPLEMLVEQFGGAIYENKNGSFRWSLNKVSSLRTAAGMLLYYLIAKKDVCSTFLEALKLFPEDRVNRFAGERAWSEENALKVAQIAMKLNNRDKPILGDIKTVYSVDAIIGGDDGSS